MKEFTKTYNHSHSGTPGGKRFFIVYPFASPSLSHTDSQRFKYLLVSIIPLRILRSAYAH